MNSTNVKKQRWAVKKTSLHVSLHSVEKQNKLKGATCTYSSILPLFQNKDNNDNKILSNYLIILEKQI